MTTISTASFCRRDKKQGQRGNAIFAIILGVILFGALTWAVTQANRGQGNLGQTETSLILASQITSNPSSIRQTADLMILKGRTGAELRFNADQSTAAAATTDPTDFDYLANVFNPAGEGGAAWSQPPADSLTDLTCITTLAYSVGAAATGDRAGCWYYKRNVTLPGIGINATADVVIALPNLKQGVCEQINLKLFGATTIEASGIALASWTTAATAVDMTAGTYTSGRPFACVQNTGGDYLYYHTIVER